MSATSKLPILDPKGQLLSPLIPGYRGRYLQNAALVSSGFCIATLLVCILIFLVRRGRRKFPPGVSFWRIAPAFYQGRDGSAEALNALWLQVFEQNKERLVVTWHPLARTYIFTCASPEILEHVMVSHQASYDKGEALKDMFQDVLGNGIFNTDGDDWREQRQLVHSAFANGELRRHMCNTFVAHAQAVGEVMKKFCNSGKPVDIQKVMESYTFDSFVDVAFGKAFLRGDRTSTAGNSASELVQAFQICTKHIKSRCFNPIWKTQRFLNVGGEKRFKQALTCINTIIEGAIAESMNNPKAERPVFLKKLLDKKLGRNEEKKTFLRDIVVSLMLAGRDTTSALLSWTLFFLSQHSRVEAKLLSELSALSGRIPDFDSLRSMHYLNATLTEVLRLRPPIVSTARCCKCDDTLPCGYKIKKGEYISFHILSMGRSTFLWKEPLEFQPERFIVQGKFVAPHPTVFPVFNAGRRTCAGKDTSYIEAGVLLATILPDYRFVLGISPEAVLPSNSLSSNIFGGLPVTVHARE